MAQENREAYIAWLREKLEDYCNDDGSYEVYWDYDDSITPDQLVEAVDNWKSEGYTSPESYLASTLYDTVGEAQESQLYVSILDDLQRLVGGNIEPFDVIFGEGISLYVNEEGLFTCPPNRAVYATKGMEEAGYLSMMDYSSPVKEGELYSILCGDLVAVGFDFETGENRDLSVDEMSRVADYFTEVSKPGSGIEEVIAIRTGQRREEARSEDGRVTLKGEAQASRAASEKLAEGRGTGSPARDDHSIV